MMQRQIDVLVWGVTIATLLSQPVWAEERADNKAQIITEMPRIQEIKRPATTVKEWLSQTPTPDAQMVQVTGVKLNQTDAGIEVVLETTKSEQLQVSERNEGNSYIADIKNAQLRLPSGNTFRQENPALGITAVTVANSDANTIRVTVAGDLGVPVVELFDSPESGLIFSVISAASSTPQGQQPET